LPSFRQGFSVRENGIPAGFALQLGVSAPDLAESGDGLGRISPKAL
jgi:hypothetical protein